MLRDTLNNNISSISNAGIAIISSWAAASPDSTLGNSIISFITQALIYLFTLFLILSSVRRVGKINKRYIVIVIAPIIYWLIYVLDIYSLVSLQITNLVILLCFSLADGNVKSKAFDIYKKILVVISVIGIICSIINFFHIPILSPRIVDFYDGDGYGKYVDYRVCYILDNGVAFRLCGLFNEPGYLGTIISLVLCVEGLNFKKWENICMLIAGILTFSLAFFLVIFIYLLISSFRHFGTFLFVIFLIVLFFAVILPEIDNIQNDTIRIFLKRLTFEDGEWLGDSRSGGMVDMYFNNLSNSGHALWGYGTGFTSSSMFESTSTYKQFVVNYGYVGAGLMWGYLLLSSVCYSKNAKIVLSFIFCFFISIYQRPQVFNIVFFLILFGGIDYILCKSISNKKFL
jgi:hypothetical protein